MGWNQVRWTEAHQVASLMGVDDDGLPKAGVTPEEHFHALREADDPAAAVSFLGHALPRLEALAWAAHLLEEQAQTLDLKRADRQALDHALRWLGDPSDPSRRATMEAANAAGERSPERVLAMAVFFSGGSISEPDLEPVLPEPFIAGRMAAASVNIASLRAPDRLAFFAHALDLGDRVASDGIKALEAA